MTPVVKIILMVLITWVITELIKTIIESVKAGKFSPKFLLAYGGMPSAHSSFVASIATSLYLIEGMTTVFLLSLGLGILVVRDITVIRNQIDRNSKAITKLHKDKIHIKPISHSVLEIIIGVTIGIIIPLILNILI